MGHTIATIFLPRSQVRHILAKSDIFRISQGVGVCPSKGRCTGASSMRHRRFPGAKGARLHFSNTVAAEFNGSEPSIWTVLQEKVYRSITHVAITSANLICVCSTRGDALSSR